MNNTKLVLNLVIDNSASMKGDKIEHLKNALSKFDSDLISVSLSDRIEYSVVVFEGLGSIVFKNFEDRLSLDNFSARGIPFVNDAILKGVSGLLKRVEELEKAAIETYKPWTILLLNGENYDNSEESSELILKVMKDGKMSYFPFLLSDTEMDKSLEKLKKIKPFTVVKDNRYDDLFAWVLNTAIERTEKPKSEPISISPNSFEGWTIK